MTGLAELFELVEAGEVLVPLTFAKRPIIRWKDEPMPPGRISAFADVAEMWARVIPQGLVVLDLDDGQPPPSDWPSTKTWKTPRGYHVAYLTNARFTKRPVQVGGRKVDVMPAGTLQVLLGPGRELIWNWPPVPLPDELEEALTGRPAAESVGGSAFPRSGSIKHVRAYLDRCQYHAFIAVRDAPEGTRNATLLIEAKKLAKVGADFTKAGQALAKAARIAGLDEEEILPTIKRGWAYGTQE